MRRCKVSPLKRPLRLGPIGLLADASRQESKAAGKSKGSGGRQSFPHASDGFRGLPRGRRDDSRPRSSAVATVQPSSPYGLPRLIHPRYAAISGSVSAPLTYATLDVTAAGQLIVVGLDRGRLGPHMVHSIEHGEHVAGRTASASASSWHALNLHCPRDGDKLKRLPPPFSGFCP